VDRFPAELLIGGVVPDSFPDDVAVPALAREVADDCVTKEFAVIAVLDAEPASRLLVLRENREAEPR
jgi:hypothetical protein